MYSEKQKKGVGSFIWGRAMFSKSNIRSNSLLLGKHKIPNNSIHREGKRLRPILPYSPYASPIAQTPVQTLSVPGRLQSPLGLYRQFIEL